MTEHESSADRAEIYQAPDGFRWRALGANHEIVANGEAHTSKQHAKRAVKELWPDMPDDKIVFVEQ